MKKQIVSVFILTGFVVGLALAQSEIRGKRQAQKPKFDEKLGTCNITGFSKDDVWAAALKALKEEKIEVVKTSKSWIFARQTLGDRVEVDVAVVDHPKADALRPWAPAISLGIDVPEIGELGDFRSWTAIQRRALSRKLFEKIIDSLYNPPAK